MAQNLIFYRETYILLCDFVVADRFHNKNTQLGWRNWHFTDSYRELPAKKGQ